MASFKGHCEDCVRGLGEEKEAQVWSLFGEECDNERSTKIE